MNVMIGADHTDVFRKHKIPVEYDNFCISIITSKRTLDLRYDDVKIVQIWFDKIKSLINARDDSRLLRGETEGSEMPKSKKEELREIIDEIWRCEILVNW